MLALSAAVLLISGIAFGFSKSNSGSCCNVAASTCCGVPCSDSGQCPVSCCEAGSDAAAK